MMMTNKKLGEKIDELSKSLQEIHIKLDNHLEHHKFLEKMNSTRREWVRWTIPLVVTVIIFLFSILGGK